MPQTVDDSIMRTSPIASLSRDVSVQVLKVLALSNFGSAYIQHMSKQCTKLSRTNFGRGDIKRDRLMAQWDDEIQIKRAGLILE